MGVGRSEKMVMDGAKGGAQGRSWCASDATRKNGWCGCVPALASGAYPTHRLFVHRARLLPSCHVFLGSTSGPTSVPAFGHV